MVWFVRLEGYRLSGKCPALIPMVQSSICLCILHWKRFHGPDGAIQWNAANNEKQKMLSNNRSFLGKWPIMHERKLDAHGLRSLGWKQRVKVAKEFSRLCLILYYCEFLVVKKNHIWEFYICVLFTSYLLLLFWLLNFKPSTSSCAF